MLGSQALIREIFFDRAVGGQGVMETAEATDRLARLVRELGIRLGDSVLAVGCGTGSLLPPLVVATGGLAPLVTLDISTELLGCTCNNGLALPRLCPDAVQLPFQSHTFAWVICNAVFPRFAKKMLALRELGRVMGAAGRLVIYHPHGRSGGNTHPRAGDELAAPALDQMAAWLRAASLTPLILRDEPDHYLVVAGHDLVSHGGTIDAC